MNSTDALLTLLTIVTGVLAIATFFNNRRKDSRKDGEREAIIRADLAYIKDILVDVRRETKEIRGLVDDHAQRLARHEEQISQAFERIKHIEDHLDNLNGG